MKVQKIEKINKIENNLKSRPDFENKKQKEVATDEFKKIFERKMRKYEIL